MLVEELEVGARVGRECGIAPTEDDWPDEELELVDQPCHESLCRKVRATHDEIPAGGGLQVVYRPGSKWRSRRVFAVDVTARVEE